MYHIPEDTQPKFVSATCLTKIRSLLICGGSQSLLTQDLGWSQQVSGHRWALCAPVFKQFPAAYCAFLNQRAVSTRGFNSSLGILRFRFFFCLFVSWWFKKVNNFWSNSVYYLKRSKQLRGLIYCFPPGWNNLAIRNFQVGLSCVPLNRLSCILVSK